MPTAKLYSTREAASELDMDEGYIRRLAVKHGIGEKVGERAWVFRARDLERLAGHRWAPGKRGKPRQRPPAAQTGETLVIASATTA